MYCIVLYCIVTNYSRYDIDNTKFIKFGFLLDSPACSKDKLLIRDSKGASRVVCGGSSSSVPPPMKFYGSQVTLNFVSDGSGSGKGFLLRYNLTAVPITGVRYQKQSKSFITQIHTATYMRANTIHNLLSSIMCDII